MKKTRTTKSHTSPGSTQHAIYATHFAQREFVVHSKSRHIKTHVECVKRLTATYVIDLTLTDSLVIKMI